VLVRRIGRAGRAFLKGKCGHSSGCRSELIKGDDVGRGPLKKPRRKPGREFVNKNDQDGVGSSDILAVRGDSRLDPSLGPRALPPSRPHLVDELSSYPLALGDRIFPQRRAVRSPRTRSFRNPAATLTYAAEAHTAKFSSASSRRIARIHSLSLSLSLSRSSGRRASTDALPSPRREHLFRTEKTSHRTPRAGLAGVRKLIVGGASDAFVKVGGAGRGRGARDSYEGIDVPVADFTSFFTQRLLGPTLPDLLPRP
jgi:hypothetical protein